MTKKTKIITLCTSILAIIVLLVILSSTLFAVNEVKVSFKSEKHVLASLSEKEIVESANIQNGTNVFFVSKKDAIDRLEKKYPYIKVLNIETKFPNKIIIHAIERDEIFAFQVAGKYMVTDSELKVLRIVDGEFSSNNSNAIKIISDGELANEGEFLQVGQKFLSLKTLEESNYQNFSVEESASALSAFLATYKQIAVFDEKIVLQTFLGVKVNMYSPTFKQQEKLKMAEIKIDELTDEQKHTGIINIFQKDGKVVGTYSDNE